MTPERSSARLPLNEFVTIESSYAGLSGRARPGAHLRARPAGAGPAGARPPGRAFFPFNECVIVSAPGEPGPPDLSWSRTLRSVVLGLSVCVQRVRCVRALRSVRSAFGPRSRPVRSGLAFGAFAVLRSARPGAAFGGAFRSLRLVRSPGASLRSGLAFGLRSVPRVRRCAFGPRSAPDA